MKKKLPTLILRIPEPCNEDWDNMSPTANGRDCRSCSRELIDFTQWPDSQLVAYIENTSGKICGHFSSRQLNRNLLPAPVSPMHYRHLSLPALALLAMTLTAQISYGQETDTVQTEIISLQKPAPAVSADADTIYGNVVRFIDGMESGDLPYVHIYLMQGASTLRKVFTDTAGNFVLPVLPGESPDLILFRKSDYGTKKITFSPDLFNKPLTVALRGPGTNRRTLGYIIPSED